MSSKNLARVIFILLLIAVTAAFLMQISSGDLPRVEHLDKVVHFGSFFVLAWAFHHAFRLPIWLALIVLTGYGLLIEYVQELLPYRDSSWGDLLADGAGAATFYLIAWWRFVRHRKQKAKTSSSSST
ncbi:VanZ family protein [Pseudidiomarina terrestris]|uniref:VanZ family protein n=1 Tax=Pseudidiomarina terrestris TaxID=2820060 RepID=A0AAW7QZF9_9GAMM|nr:MULTISPECIES: VanZ family protein [unclassified Pseudidiomarina]MDN7125144.1 VanZ family protein [Pseudidiomarina sp. 1APP75-32.1]MDN7127453.1 VanZ family protein [Pseudidiomarina sp. 1APR75-33.1]MDN7129905.1 VanZ family protein [Pseudidiomarina sp. 1APR75-15]MDN7136071.1 VanZ family protein [Pseudidiomarina sp. 1ASP75-5]MDN7138404.1 VanZ family protein [Pseudidiomarina sp. 1ASP75-14]